jgi:hypothetical protein
MKTRAFPDSLRTATASEGHLLARELAERALLDRVGTARDIAAHLSAPPQPSLEALTAAYFQAVAAANHGWRS